MGVRGLFSTLDKTNTSAEKQDQLREGDTLLIDGSSWCFHLYRSFCEAQLLEGGQTKYEHWGGSYKNLAKIVSQYVSILKDTLGLNVVVFLDGRVELNSCDHVSAVSEYFKLKTKQQRAEERLREWYMLEQLCKQLDIDCEPRSLPLPLLCSHQFRLTLEQIGVKVIMCQGEADVQIAKYSQSDETKRSFVVGNDSDFVVYRDCRIIRTDKLDAACLNPALSQPQPNGGKPTPEISFLAQESCYESIFEQKWSGDDSSFCKLVDLAILSGNDYSNSFTFDTILGAVGETNASRPAGHTVQKVAEWLKKKPSGWNLLTASRNFSRTDKTIKGMDSSMKEGVLQRETIREVIEVCYAMYSGNAEKYNSGKGSNTAKRLRSECVKFKVEQDKLQAVAPLAHRRKHDILATVFEIVVKTESMRKAPETDESLVGLVRTALHNIPNSLVDQTHLMALEAMCHHINSPDQQVVEPQPFMARPAFQDLLIGHMYQTVVRKCCQKFGEDFPLWGKFEPKYLYDGRVFHAMLHTIRIQNNLPADGLSSRHVAHAGLTNVTNQGEEESEMLDPYNEADIVGNVDDVDENDSDIQAALDLESYMKPLPIDSHEDAILDVIERNRVIIIQGETGCGKSSRVPIMLMRQADSNGGPKARIVISQPRRIACKGLFNRLSQDPYYGEQVGLRIGHGEKLGSTKLFSSTSFGSSKLDSLLCCVTPGYITRLLAHHDDSLANITHMIIDEVHERSMDTDLLCYLCKELLLRQPNLKLILMSATVQTDIYQEYFEGVVPGMVSEPVFVGVRTFPVDEYYCDDDLQNLSTTTDMLARELSKKLASEREFVPSLQVAQKQYDLAVSIARQVGTPGSAVLIFVGGMRDIETLAEKFEVANKKSEYDLVVSAIHSDIPVDEQMMAFEKSERNQVKIILATNAAESSVTIPDVDTVICLGLCKEIVYNPVTHRSRLEAQWISKSAAIQRAGRTGRVRPGQVFRLYTRSVFQRMDSCPRAEVHQKPLDSIVLMMRTIWNDSPVAGVLGDLIEPPPMQYIARSYVALHKHGLVSHDNDDLATTTQLGKFVSGLGIDPYLGRLIGIGLMIGVVREAVAIAAIVSFSRSPLHGVNRLFQDPTEYNAIAQQLILAQWKWDRGELMSEPLTIMRMMIGYEKYQGSKFQFMKINAMNPTRTKQLMSLIKSLRTKTAAMLVQMEQQVQGATTRYAPLSRDVRHESFVKLLAFDSKYDEFKLSEETILLLRLLLVWIGPDQIVQLKDGKSMTKVRQFQRPEIVVAASMISQNGSKSKKAIPSETIEDITVDGDSEDITPSSNKASRKATKSKGGKRASTSNTANVDSSTTSKKLDSSGESSVSTSVQNDKSKPKGKGKQNKASGKNVKKSSKPQNNTGTISVAQPTDKSEVVDAVSTDTTLVGSQEKQTNSKLTSSKKKNKTKQHPKTSKGNSKKTRNGSVPSFSVLPDEKPASPSKTSRDVEESTVASKLSPIAYCQRIQVHTVGNVKLTQKDFDTLFNPSVVCSELGRHVRDVPFVAGSGYATDLFHFVNTKKIVYSVPEKYVKLEIDQVVDNFISKFVEKTQLEFAFVIFNNSVDSSSDDDDSSFYTDSDSDVDFNFNEKFVRFYLKNGILNLPAQIRKQASKILELHESTATKIDLTFSFRKSHKTFANLLGTMFSKYVHCTFASGSPLRFTCCEVEMVERDFSQLLGNDSEHIYFHSQTMESKQELLFPINVESKMSNVMAQGAQLQEMKSCWPEFAAPHIGIQLLGAAFARTFSSSKARRTVHLSRQREVPETSAKPNGSAKKGKSSNKEKSDGVGHDLLEFKVGISAPVWKPAFDCNSLEGTVTFSNTFSIVQLSCMTPESTASDLLVDTRCNQLQGAETVADLIHKSSGSEPKAMELYGVCGTMLELKHGARAENVTLLPPVGKGGCDWVIKALLCCDKISDIDDYKHSITSTELEHCMTAQQILTFRDWERPLSFDPQLRKTLLEAFLIQQVSDENLEGS